MDLSNLTFDELLDAIRSDSGYQSAQAQKTDIPEEPVKETPETAEEITEGFSEFTFEEALIEEPAKENFLVEEPLPEDFFTEEPATENFTIEEPMADDLLTEESATGNFFIDEPVAAILFDEEPAENKNETFTPPTAPLDLFEEELPEEDIPDVWQVPESDSEEYQPIALDPIDEYSDDAEEADEEITADESVYIPPEPIELIFPDETEDEEPIKIYTPPKPEPIDFGGFDITADVASLFPDISDEDMAEEEPVPHPPCRAQQFLSYRSNNHPQRNRNPL